MKYIFFLLTPLLFIPLLTNAEEAFVDSSVLNITTETFESDDDFARSIGKESFEDVEFYNGLYSEDVQFTLSVPGAISCFDHYEFGSVEVVLESAIETALPGVPVDFSVVVRNNNPYPIIDGSVIIKIFRENSDIDVRLTQGNHTIDQFNALNGINLGAHEESTYTFTWVPPLEISGGRYYAATHFATAGRFNLSGLTFTDDIVGSTYMFRVVSDNTPIYFEKNSVQINDARYFFIGQPQAVPDTPTDIQVTLRNDSDIDRELNIVWFLYRWDALRAENLIEQIPQRVVAPAGGSVDVTYIARDIDYSAYLAVPVLYDASGNLLGSFLNIRFLRENVDVPRINFPTVLSYPIVAGEEVSLFACLHNAGLGDVVGDVALDLELVDSRNRTLHSYSYEGDITGAMLGFLDSFTPRRDYDSFTLIASVSADGELLDRVEIDYQCDELNPATQCQEEGDFAGGGIVLTLFTGLSILLLIFFVFLLKRKA